MPRFQAWVALDGQDYVSSAGLDLEQRIVLNFVALHILRVQVDEGLLYMAGQGRYQARAAHGVPMIAQPSCGQVQRIWGRDVRSEEHTSELQSLMRISYAV